jgi:putative ABC transport system permease protein
MELAVNIPAGVSARATVSKRTRPRRHSIPMVMKLAYRNLFHDRMSFFVTIIGIVFSVVLVAVQSGIYLGSQNKISAIIDSAPADLWVIPLGTKSYDDPSFLSGRERHMVLSTPGVENSEDMVVSFASWRKPQGGRNTILLIGTAGDSPKALPWNIVKGSRAALEAPDTVAIDQSYFADLGVNGLGQRAEINGASVELVAITKRIRSFTTLPFVFTSIEEARRLSGAEQDQASYQRVTLTSGADIEKVRAEIEQRLPDTEVLTQDEFRKRSQNYWLFRRGPARL